MNYEKNVWGQIRNKSAGDIIKALEKDGFIPDDPLRTERIYRHPDGRLVSIHYHSNDRCYGPKLLKGLFDDIAWSEADMKRLKFIK